MTTETELPPLPDETEFDTSGLGVVYAFTADQMLSFARQAVAAERARILALLADCPQCGFLAVPPRNVAAIRGE